MHSFQYQSTLIPSIIGRQGELLHALISISIYSHSQYNREARGATSRTHFNITLFSFLSYKEWDLDDIGMSASSSSPCLPIILKRKLANAGTPTFSDFVPWISLIQQWVFRKGTLVKWGQNEKEKNLGHMPWFKNFIIPPSFQSFTTIAEWENGHFSIISFILRSVGIRMTIEWLTSHFTMIQNDRDEPGMRLIEIFSLENFPP